MGQTSAAVDAAAGYCPGGTSDSVDRLVDGEDDIGDARVVAMMRQQIAAARPAYALDQTAAAQLAKSCSRYDSEISWRSAMSERQTGRSLP